MKTPSFRSSLTAELESFIRFKRMEGYDYTSRALRLERFDRFLVRQGHAGAVLTRDTVEAYIRSTIRLTPGSRHADLSVVRVFSRYLQGLRPQSHVLDGYGFRVPCQVRFHLYSSGELAALLKAARALPAAGSPRGPCLQLLIGLLYATGLRISEALALNLADVDTDRGRLLVRRGKFGKSRYVPLHATTVERLQAWFAIRSRYARHDSGEPLFIGRHARRLSRSLAESRFRRLLLACGIRDREGRTPRLHDLRHSYASECLRRWQAQGLDLNVWLPVLATAMGHVGLRSTQVYLHTVPAQLHNAISRLHQHLFDRATGVQP